ncbi:vanin-like protein 1 [Vespula squamosa]|uniref:Vanin-like protein 1 n=1 Tax=Vespula squamosa TaxID=30214 RepID=A0ABD1ZW18_VESSQ
MSKKHLVWKTNSKRTIMSNTYCRWILLYLLITYTRSSSQVNINLSYEETKKKEMIVYERCLIASTPDSKSYIAAVVEFAPKSVTNNSEFTLQSNTLEYEELIKDANKQNADIIVFPEDGITSYNLPMKNEMDPWATVIPSAKAKYTPCTTNANDISETLKNISCAAKNNSIYVVVNIAEKEVCTKNGCPEKRTYYYNTNVVFDRNGTIIAKYRKINLYIEPEFDRPIHPEVVTFDTDFGVKFGTFICFDILFAEPALNLTRNHKITDIVFTTAWFSETPFLTAVQTQAGWAYAENVNLLAAGYNNPSKGSTGSGIYLGRNKTSKAVMLFDRGTQLLIAEVPKMPNKVQSLKSEENTESEENKYAHVHDELRKKREVIEEPLKLLRDDVSLYQTEVLNGNATKILCHNNHCCNFTIQMPNLDTNVQYRMVVFNGLRNLAKIRWIGTRFCAIIQCSNNTIESCGSVVNSAATFNEITISGEFKDSKNSLIMPNTLSKLLLPLDNWMYQEYPQNNDKHVSIYSNVTMTNPITFGIYCRDYDKDIKSTASSNNIVYLFSILMAFLLNIL